MKIFIQRLTTIRKQVDGIYPKIADFSEWKIWSPWLIADPKTRINISENGKFYQWESPITGTGNMKIMEENKPSQIDMNLQFLKPMKSRSKVSFFLEPQGPNTKVTWTMEFNAPIFFIFWKKSMENFIGMDYERGLLMLKDYCETGNIPSYLTFSGIKNVASKKYIGIKTTCEMNQIDKHMSADFEQLFAFVNKEFDDVVTSGKGMSLYHKWDMAKKITTYTAAIEVKDFPPKIPLQFVKGTIPASKFYCIEHKGPYRYMANAWAVQMMHKRSKQFKANKGISPMELYHNSPKEVANTSDLITEVMMATK